MQQLLGISASSVSLERSCLVFSEWRCNFLWAQHNPVPRVQLGLAEFLGSCSSVDFPVCARPYSSSKQNAWAVSYCHLWPVWLCQIYPHYLINDMIFEKKLLNLKFVFWFSLQILSETFLIPRTTEWDIIINAHWSSCTVHIIVVRFQWNFYFRVRFSKYSNIKFYENPSSVNRVVSCGGKDGRTDIEAWQN